MEASHFICYSVSQLQRRKPILYVTCQICAQESSQSLSHSLLPSDFQKLWEYLKNLYFSLRIFPFSFIPFIQQLKSIYQLKSNQTCPCKFGISSWSQHKCSTDWLSSSVINANILDDPSNTPVALMGSLVTPSATQICLHHPSLHPLFSLLHCLLSSTVLAAICFA